MKEYNMYTGKVDEEGKSAPEIIKPFSCPIQLTMKFIMFINVVGFLTFISMTNATSESLKACKVFYF